jgi:hypothetical protein
MKKVLFTTAAAMLALAVFAQQIPNAGFENWNTTAGYNNPDDWDNTNSIMGSMGAYTVTKGTPGNPGDSYIKITTVSHMGTTIPGIAVSGSLDISNPLDIKYSGFAFSERPEKLTGSWQYMAMGPNDQGFIYVLLTKWNAATMSRDTVGSGRELLAGMVMSWADFSIPMTYSDPAPPDSAIIVLAASGAGTELTANSYLYVDNLAFQDGGTGINAATKLVEDLTVYPVPAKNTMTVYFKTINKAQKLSVELTDIQGRSLLQKTIKENHFILDVSIIASGNYFLKITDGRQSQVKKVTIEK